MKLRKALITAVAAMSLLAGTMSSALSDINGHWADNTIKSLVQDKTINGYPDGTFKPDNNITRAEATKIIAAIKNEELLDYSGEFGDVPNENWSAKYIATLSSKHIISGYPDGSFRPDNLITRAEFAKMTNATLEITDGMQSSVSFSDVGSHWASESILNLSGKKIINGYSDGTFRPDNYITRAEASSIVFKSIKYTDSNRLIDYDVIDSPSNNQKPDETPVVTNNSFTQATVIRVVDGDTIIVNLNNEEYRLRMIGVDTPESVHSDSSKNTECGKIASDYTKSRLTSGSTVYLQKDVSETDRYGRLLRYVWLSRPSSNEPSESEIRASMYNAELALKGYAKAATYPPDVKYADLFNKLVGEAREGNVGLWSNSNNCTPEGRASTAPQTNTPNPKPSESSLGSGPIKGNISSSGEKIYHVPGGSSYEKTVVGDKPGERYFETEEEARAAGFRRALR